jgi:hypothetical protein
MLYGGRTDFTVYDDVDDGNGNEDINVIKHK